MRRGTMRVEDKSTSTRSGNIASIWSGCGEPNPGFPTDAVVSSFPPILVAVASCDCSVILVPCLRTMPESEFLFRCYSDPWSQRLSTTLGSRTERHPRIASHQEQRKSPTGEINVLAEIVKQS